jgi:leucine dehydrogenase
VAAKTGARIVSTDAIFDVDADVFAPCALGGAISTTTLPRLKVKVIAGGANNQLADKTIGQAVFERGILYAPDYVINGGGIINVAGEIRALEAGTAFDPDWVADQARPPGPDPGRGAGPLAGRPRPANLVADEIARSRIAAARG